MMRELTLKTAKRGMRIFHGEGVQLGVGKPTSRYRRGTVLEITKSIPNGTNRGKPGVLVYFDYLQMRGVLPKQTGDVNSALDVISIIHQVKVIPFSQNGRKE